MSRPRQSTPAAMRAEVARWTPLLVWLASIVMLFLLASPWRGAERLPAMAEVVRSTVLAPRDGRLAAAPVGLHDTVTAGQILARLDDTAVQVRLREAQATLERLRAELQRAATELEHAQRSDQVEHELTTSIEQRRLATTRETAMLDALATRTQLEEARVRVGGSAIEAERTEKLVAQGIAGEPDLVRVRTERDALQKRVAELELLYDERCAFVAAAERRLQQFQPTALPDPSIELHLAPLRWQIQAHTAAMDGLAAEARDLDLRSPTAGRVEALSALAGEWVRAGQCIATVVEPTVRHIVGYVPPEAWSCTQTTAPAQVFDVDDRWLGEARLLSVSPAATIVPPRLWRVPGRQEHAFEARFGTTGRELPGQELRLVLR